MQDVETVTEAFVAFLENQGIGTFGTDIYLHQVPDDAPDACYWILTAGGSPVRVLSTGEKVKQYFVTVNYRSMSEKDVDRNLFRLEELLNCAGCVDLEGFEVYQISAQQFPTDSDADLVERRTAFLQANVQVYKSC